MEQEITRVDSRVAVMTSVTTLERSPPPRLGCTGKSLIRVTLIVVILDSFDVQCGS